MRQSYARIYHILALISSSDEIYIRQCTSNNYKAFYRNHWQGKCTATAHYFEENTPPKLYLLETYDATSDQAFARCIAWYLYFKRYEYHGSASAVRYHIDHPRANDLAACEEISQRDLHEILATDLAANWYFAPAEHTISYNVSAEDYAALSKAAKSHNLTLAEYCQARFKEKALNSPDIRELAQCSNQTRVVYSFLNNIIAQQMLLDNNQVSEQLIYEINSLRQNIQDLESAILGLTR